jgi:hypothetical protein
LPEPNARFRFGIRAAINVFEPEREFEPKSPSIPIILLKIAIFLP